MAVTFTNFLSGDPVPAWGSGFVVNSQSIIDRETANFDKSHFIDVIFNSSVAVYRVFIVLETGSTFNFFDVANQTFTPSNNISPVTRWGAVSVWSRSGGQVVQAIIPWQASNSIGINGTTYGIHVIDANIPFTFAGTPYDPTQHDERFFTKDPSAYILNVGVAADETSEYNNYYYATKSYKINLRWTSLKTGIEYTLPVNTAVANTPVILSPEIIGVGYSFNYVTTTGTTARALRMPLGVYASASDIPTEYSELTDLRSFTTITLQTLIDYMKTQTAGATEQDIFTEIFADFIVNDTVIETLSCDYSSLYGDESVDVNAGTVNDPNAADSVDDTNIYTDSIELTTPALTATGVFNRCYTLDGNSINDLCDFLYNADDSIFSEIIDGVLTRGNPIESLIDLRLYPFDVRQFTGGGVAQSIKFGRTDTGVIGAKLPHNANAVISLGSCVVPRVYNNFLDYQMEITLFIPFCGVVSLPVDRVLNHTVSINLIVDYVTGSCTAVVYVDSIPLLYQSGVIGVSIPMTATNSAEFAKTIVGNLITGASQIAGKNAGGAARTALETASVLHDGSHIQTAGASSPQTALFQPKNAYILLSIVNPAEGVYTDTYAESVGYECFMPVSTIGTMDGNGFVAFDNVRLSIEQATEQEKAEILSLLAAGVYM